MPVLRIDGKNDVCSAGPVILRRLHRRRRCEASDDIGIIPAVRSRGTCAAIST